MNKILSSMLSSAVFSSIAIAECVPPRTEVPWPDKYVALGKYHRVHPSGDYVLVSHVKGLGNSKVVILDLKDRNPDGTPKVIATPFANEAYPDANWDLISSPVGRSTPPMDYYSFKDILKNKDALVSSVQEGTPQPKIPVVYSDPEHGEWYQSIAELPGSSPKDKKICTLLYTNSKEKCYNFKLDDNGKMVKDGVPEVTANAPLCGEGHSWSGPVLSKDGSFVSTIGESTIIYPIQRKSDGKNITTTCGTPITLHGVSTKVSFSYPSTTPKSVTYHTCGPYKDMSMRCGVKVHDLDKNVSTWLTATTESAQYYPNFTADGRIIYTDATSRKIITIDPNQIDEEGKVKTDRSKCIQVNGKVSTQTAPEQPKTKSE